MRSPRAMRNAASAELRLWVWRDLRWARVIAGYSRLAGEVLVGEAAAGLDPAQSAIASGSSSSARTRARNSAASAP